MAEQPDVGPLLFDAAWRKKAKQSASAGSWAHNWESGEQRRYTRTIRRYFRDANICLKDRRLLKLALENFGTTHADHVNELFWQARMQLAGFDVAYVATVPGSRRPDFHIVNRRTGFQAYVEVTTINLSNAKRIGARRRAGKSITLDKRNFVCRVHRKAIREKAPQLDLARQHKMPGILVVFNSSDFAGYGTAMPRDVALGFANRTRRGLWMRLPRSISALVLVGKTCVDGRLRLVKSESAIFLNRRATFPIDKRIFRFLNQIDVQA